MFLEISQLRGILFSSWIFCAFGLFLSAFTVNSAVPSHNRRHRQPMRLEVAGEHRPVFSSSQSRRMGFIVAVYVFDFATS
jgi:hypothetical protein